MQHQNLKSFTSNEDINMSCNSEQQSERGQESSLEAVDVITGKNVKKKSRASTSLDSSSAFCAAITQLC